VFAKQTPAATQILGKFTGRQTAFRTLAKRPERAPACRFYSVFEAQRVAVYPATPDVTGDQAGLRKTPPCLRIFEGRSVSRVIVAEERRPANKLQKLPPEKDGDGVGRTPVGSTELIELSDFSVGSKHVVKPRAPKKNIRKAELAEKRGEHRERRFDTRKNFVDGYVNSDLHLSDLSVPMISFGRRTCTARSGIGTACAASDGKMHDSSLTQCESSEVRNSDL